MEHLWSITGASLRPPQGTAGTHLAAWGDTLLFPGTFIRATGKSRVPWDPLHLAGRSALAGLQEQDSLSTARQAIGGTIWV